MKTMLVKAIAALDGRGLQRHQPFDDTHPMYDLPQSLDGGGSLQVLCVGHADAIVGVNSGKPSKSFMTFLGAVARDVTGADATRVIAAASQCYRSAALHKVRKAECMLATRSLRRLSRSIAASTMISRPSAFLTSA